LTKVNGNEEECVLFIPGTVSIYAFDSNIKP
jgi:hypothetical protein